MGSPTTVDVTHAMQIGVFFGSSRTIRSLATTESGEILEETRYSLNVFENPGCSLKPQQRERSTYVASACSQSVRDRCEVLLVIDGWHN